jgi:hypothetical protein
MTRSIGLGLGIFKSRFLGYFFSLSFQRSRFLGCLHGYFFSLSFKRFFLLSLLPVSPFYLIL